MATVSDEIIKYRPAVITDTWRGILMDLTRRVVESTPTDCAITTRAIITNMTKHRGPLSRGRLALSTQGLTVIVYV
jgi:hypothetical protein